MAGSVYVKTELFMDLSIQISFVIEIEAWLKTCIYIMKIF